MSATLRRSGDAPHCGTLRTCFAGGSYLKALEKLAKVGLVVLDDWGLAVVEGQAANDLMDVVDDRAGVRSTIVAGQLPVSTWHHLASDPGIADALPDSLPH